MLRQKLHFNGFPFSWKEVSKNLLWRNHHCPYSKLWRLCPFHWLSLAYLFRALSFKPLSLFKTVKVLSFSLIVFSLFISSPSRIFLSYMYWEMRTVSGCSQSNWPWHSFACSVAPDDSHFPLLLSCWCSVHQ